MATFSVRFLGCKVSFADAQAVRERLLADGHTQVDGGGDVAVVNTCCVTHEAVSKSRQAVSRAARAHRQVYATGCGARLDGALEGIAAHVAVVSAQSDEATAEIAKRMQPRRLTNAIRQERVWRSARMPPPRTSA